jgi:curved DNA-binding protein CbpA
MGKMNPFEILGVSIDATDKDIKKAYIKLSKEHHPDKGGDKERFQEILNAYEVLKNRETREFIIKYGDVDQSMINEAVKLATELFISCIHESNIIQVCHDRIDSVEFNTKKDIGKNKDEIIVLEEFLVRIRKKPKDDFLSKAIKNKIQNHKNLIQQRERLITINNMVNDMVNMYEFETKEEDGNPFKTFSAMLAWY